VVVNNCLARGQRASIQERSDTEIAFGFCPTIGISLVQFHEDDAKFLATLYNDFLEFSTA
jgi:hypothetical protein